MSYSLSRAEFIALIAMLHATVAFSIDSMLPALGAMAMDISPDAPNRVQLVITAFLLGMGGGTLFVGPLADAFGARTTPHVYFFDQTFKLIYTGSIDNSWDKGRKSDEPYLFNAIKAQGKGKKIKPNTTEPKGCGIKRVTTTPKN